MNEDSTQVRAKAQEIVRFQTAVLYGVLEAIDEAWKKNRSQFEKVAREMDYAKENLTFQSPGFYREQVARLIGQFNGLHDARKIVNDALDELIE